MNLALVEKESKTCLLILPKHVVLQAMWPAVLPHWMILKAATLLIWQFLLLSLLLFASEKGGGQFGLLTWAHLRRRRCPKMPRFSGPIPICNHIQARQDKFQICMISLHCPWMFPYHPFQIVNSFLKELQARVQAFLIHMYAVGFMQTALTLWFCEMDSFITECDGDDTTTLYLHRMPHSCLIR